MDQTLERLKSIFFESTAGNISIQNVCFFIVIDDQNDFCIYDYGYKLIVSSCVPKQGFPGFSPI